FFRYPLQAKDVVPRLGLVESGRCALSYLWSRARKPRNPETFEEWVTAHFGRRLYDAFFRSYTEKVWGIPGSEIMSEWAAQRIKNFSLFKALLSVTGLRHEHVTTLIEEFRYPRLGPGQMWETLQARLEERDVPVLLEHRAVAITHERGSVRSVVVRSPEGEQELPAEAVISSIPLRELVSILDPPPPPEVLEAARLLRFGAWSEGMVVPGTTCLGMEYFCFEGDDVWELPEQEAIRFAADELGRIGLIDPALPVVRDYVERFENLKTCGRNGLHRYNNQDHSMWTAILATLNLLDGTGYD